MATTDANVPGEGSEPLVDDQKLPQYAEKPPLEQSHPQEQATMNNNNSSPRSYEGKVGDTHTPVRSDPPIQTGPHTPVRSDSPIKTAPLAGQPAPLAVDEVDAYDRLLSEPPGGEKEGEGEREGDREGEPVGPCGWGPCNPPCLQPAASTYVFVGLFLVLSFVSGFQGSYTVAVLTTLEKRFNLPSRVSGMLVTVSTVGYIITILFIAQLGKGGHIPRIFAASSLAMTFSAFLYAVPHFIYGSGNDDIEHLSLYTSNNSMDLSQQGLPTQYCQLVDNANNTVCDKSEEGRDISSMDLVAFNSVAFALFVSAEIVVGVAGSPFWSLGISFLDESVSKRLSSKLIGILYTVRFLSPVASFMLGAWFLTIYATFEETSLSPDHPRWVGAWYLGYLLCAVASLLVFVPMSMLPKHLQKMIDKDRELETALEQKPDKSKEGATGKEGKEGSHFDNIKDMPKTIARLACNPVYLLTIVALMIDVLVVGYIIFMPKYLEVQYQVPAWKANLFGGMCPALAGGVASYISGQMSSRVREQDSSASFCRLTAVCSTLSIFTILAGMGLGCDPLRLAPVNHPLSSQYPGQCSSNCSCLPDVYDPVCGSDSLLYLSPCQAGCPNPTHSPPWLGNLTANMSLSGCSCTPDGQAAAGLCQVDCFPFQVMFMVVSYTSIFLLNLYNVPVTNVCLRSVNKEDKAMAFAVLMFLCSIVAFPAPAVYGFLIDSTCLVHKVATSCSDRVAQHGACLLYDRDALRFQFHSVTVVVKACATIFYIIPWLIAKRLERRALEDSGNRPDKDRDGAREGEVVPLNGQVDPPRGKSALNSHDKDAVC